LPLAHFTKVMGNGSSVAQQDRHTPFVLIFTPSADAVKAGARENRDYRINLKDLNPGQVLYHVLAKETMNSSPLELGELVLESSFTASSYGDRVLFFQHHSEVTDI